MSYADSSDFSLSGGESNLLSESSLLHSSRTGSGEGADFSLSELSLGDRTVTYRNHDEDEDKDDRAPTTPGKDDEGNQINAAVAQRLAAQAREDKLQSDLIILRKLNANLSSFNEALDETGSANERIAKQLDQTNMLLNKYVKMLGRTEDIARLVFDESWEGFDADERVLEEEYREAKEKARLEAEERQLAAQREREQREREALDKQHQEERERVDREKALRIASRGGGASGVRGVRGTRASMRGMRAVPQTATSSRGRIPTATSNAGASRPNSSLGRGVRRS